MTLGAWMGLGAGGGGVGEGTYEATWHVALKLRTVRERVGTYPHEYGSQGDMRELIAVRLTMLPVGSMGTNADGG
eukprot:CAMPEP_0206141106 /NCGR_PEP_ID=MMETSP1473-20131121/11802_1 /ASSEMBLY_ACC=CAM_ASM_001109 /TAXON_ID=1461547 /ORGANISM="Stichococcus sp, Strain RCC1054" /LENGTH=74 /DNA_ID=CAMNT_0053535519 /DNA_START=486 /DNA_END=706 /DNA_ORIENTATION=-